MGQQNEAGVVISDSFLISLQVQTHSVLVIRNKEKEKNSKVFYSAMVVFRDECRRRMVQGEFDVGSGGQVCEKLNFCLNFLAALAALYLTLITHSVSLLNFDAKSYF